MVEQTPSNRPAYGPGCETVKDQTSINNSPVLGKQLTANLGHIAVCHMMHLICGLNTSIHVRGEGGVRVV